MAFSIKHTGNENTALNANDRIRVKSSFDIQGERVKTSFDF
jgi:hypothetical protein